jgi:protein TonB
LLARGLRGILRSVLIIAEPASPTGQASQGRREKLGLGTASVFYSQSRAPQAIGALTAVALHALAAAALLSYEPARRALIAAAPIMVELIAPPAVEPKPAPVEIPPAHKPVVKPRPKKPEPLISAPAHAPSPVVATPPAPQPVLQEPAAPVIAAPVQAPAPAPVPVTAPVFNADYLHNPPPAYPQLSRRLGEEGRVILRVLVNPSGRADEVQIRTSSGHERLDEAARETVRAWKFVPAKRGEEPVAAWVLIPISFRLEG